MRNQLILILTFVIIASIETFGQVLKDTVVDYDGNVYHTVKIGTQIWIVENLKVTHYRNGKAIPNVTDSLKWYKLRTAAYCNYNNDASISKTSGKLYNWDAIHNTFNLCPIGWKIPSDTEWRKLKDNLNNGNRFCEADSKNWKNIKENIFKLLLGGYRCGDGPFDSIGTFGDWWTSSELNTDEAINWFLDFSSGKFGRNENGNSKKNGFSVRCLKDS
ncbi:MAG: fibrobacter succinogenes major paralogous domain-containing protein [Bacteroidota bacterium]